MSEMRGANTRISTLLGLAPLSLARMPAYGRSVLGRRAGPSLGQRNTNIDGFPIAGATNGPTGGNKSPAWATFSLAVDYYGYLDQASSFVACGFARGCTIAM